MEMKEDCRILFEPGTESLLLGDTGRSSSSCILERRTDLPQSVGEDEECRELEPISEF